MSLNYLFDLGGGGVARVDVRRRFSCKDDTGLSWSWPGSCLCGQPGVDASPDALSCAIVGDGLSIGKVKSAIDDGGAAGSNVFVTNGALMNSMAQPITKGANFRAGAKAVI